MMDYFTKNKMLFWCVFILIAFNAATLTFFWVTKPMPRGRHSGPNGQEVMEEKLQLSDEQIDKFEVVRESHFSRAEPLQEAIHNLRLDILDEAFSAEPDSEKIQQMLSRLEEKMGQLESELTQHFQELKRICDQQQADELKVLLIEITERNRPRPPGEHRRGPDGGFKPEQGPRPRRQ